MKPFSAVLTLLLLCSTSACATRGDLTQFEDRVSGLERRMGALEEDVTRVSDTAATSVRRAEAAEAEARQAAARADEAARKADAIFKASVSK